MMVASAIDWEEHSYYILDLSDECIMLKFECEGTIVYMDGLWYRDKCFSNGEIREM